MKKRILAFVLSGCMLVQNSAMLVQASELPAYIQEETEITEDEQSSVAEDGNTLPSDTENDGKEAPSGGDNGSVEGENEAPSGGQQEGGSGEVTDEQPETGDKEPSGEQPADDNEEPSDEQPEDGAEVPAENPSETEDEDGDIVYDEDFDKDEEKDETQEENMTSMSESASDEAVGEAAVKEFSPVGEKDKNIQYAYVEIQPEADESVVSAQSIDTAKGLYFGYEETDSKKHTGILKEYISQSGTVVVPHKLGNSYMVEIGTGVFAGMNDDDPSDTSKLPSQSTTDKTLLSSGESKILEKLNAARLKKGMAPLVMNSTLREAARRKSLDMLNRNYFSHKDPNNIETYSWLRDCGFPMSMWGENIAYNSESAEKLFDQWWNSPGHYANMMKSEFRSIGIGVYKDKSGKIMGTQIFSDSVFQNLTNVTIEFGYEKIGNRAFDGCSNLKKVTIPSTVTEIGLDAFRNCNKGLTIYGKEGSYAEIYANSHSITFKAVTEKSPITKFAFDEKEIFLEVDDWDFAGITVKPVDYEHLVKTLKKEVPEVSGKTVIDYQDDGTIHALAKGKATITARIVDVEETCEITVAEAPPVGLKSISFYEDELVLYEGESFKPSYRIVPINTTDTVEMHSSDSSVFVVNADDASLITAVKAGNATLTVSGKSADNTVSASASIKVRVLKVDKELGLPQDLKAVTNISKTLEEVSLPEGFSWKEPKSKLKADAGDPIQYFAAQYEDKERNILQDCVIPIQVTSVSAMTMAMNGKNLTAGQKISLLDTYELVPFVKYVGAQPDADFLEVSFSVDNSDIAEIDANSEAGTGRLIPKKEGKCSVTVEIRLKDSKGGYGPAQKPYGRYKKKYVFTVENAAHVSDFRIVPEAQTGVRLLDDGSIQVDEGVDKFQFRAVTLDVNNAEKNVPVKFAAGKNGVLRVKAVKGKDGVAEVTIRKTGESFVSVTAKDNGKQSRDISICVRKLSPQLQSKTCILNKLKPDVETVISMQEAEGNPINDIELYEDKELKKVADLFEGEWDSEASAYSIGFKAGDVSNITKNSYKLFLKVTTKEAAAIYSYPITVKLKNTKPVIKIKQSSTINLFYKDASARLEIDTGVDKPDSITQINVANSDSYLKAEFEQDENGDWSAIISPVGVMANNYKKVPKNIELKFNFGDYGEDYSITKKFAVKKCYKKAALAATEANAMIYTSAGNEQATFRIMNKDDKSILTMGGDDNVWIKMPDNLSDKVSMTTSDGEQDICIKLIGIRKTSLTAKATVYHDNWQEGAPCSFKLTVNSKTPSLALEKTKISLNSNSAGKEVYSIRAGAAGNEDVGIVRLKALDIVGTNSAASRLITENKLTIYPKKDETGRSLQICLNDSSTKNGTYKYKVYGWCMLGNTRIQRMNPVILSITVTNKKPSASLKAKGKIDTSDLENSWITYTPKLCNAVGNIKTAALSGPYASQFLLEDCGDGTYRVKLREDSKLGKGKYNINFVFILENGVRVESKTVTIKLSSRRQA